MTTKNVVTNEHLASIGRKYHQIFAKVCQGKLPAARVAHALQNISEGAFYHIITPVLGRRSFCIQDMIEVEKKYNPLWTFRDEWEFLKADILKQPNQSIQIEYVHLQVRGRLSARQIVGELEAENKTPASRAETALYCFQESQVMTKKAMFVALGQGGQSPAGGFYSFVVQPQDVTLTTYEFDKVYPMPINFLGLCRVRT